MYYYTMSRRGTTMNRKTNKSEQVVLDVLRGKRHWHELYSLKGNRKVIYENAIASLKKKNIIYMDKNSILRERKFSMEGDHGKMDS